MANANIPSEDWIVTVQITKYLDVRAATKERAESIAKRLIPAQFGSDGVRITKVERG